ncbi:MAG: DUF167 domain-containing protein [Rickettsiaceae bacterium]|nr:DUF167 domain-containing protein [Rickettsiaceae bacterium]
MNQIIEIKLTPKASSNKIGEIRKNVEGREVLNVYVTAVPENGRANIALVALLSKHYKIPKSSVRIIRGHTSRIKLVELCPL